MRIIDQIEHLLQLSFFAWVHPRHKGDPKRPPNKGQVCPALLFADSENALIKAAGPAMAAPW